MAALAELKQAVVAYLSPFLGGQATLTTEYPNGYRPNPLGQTTLAVGIDKIATAERQSAYLGSQPEGELYGKAFDITLRFDIYRPDTATLCHEAFAALCEALFLESCPLPFAEMWCEPLVYDKQGGGFHLTARASLPAYVARHSPAPPIERFVVLGGKLPGGGALTP